MYQLGDVKEASRLAWLCEQWRLKAARIELKFGKGSRCGGGCD